MQLFVTYNTYFLFMNCRLFFLPLVCGEVQGHICIISSKFKVLLTCCYRKHLPGCSNCYHCTFGTAGAAVVRACCAFAGPGSSGLVVSTWRRCEGVAALPPAAFLQESYTTWPHAAKPGHSHCSAGSVHLAPAQGDGHSWTLLVANLINLNVFYEFL